MLARVVVTAVIALAATACGGSTTSAEVPVPSMAGSLPAQEAFRHVESRFADLSPEARPSLENELREFLERYPQDDRARLARLYLAWIELDRKNTPEARALAARVRSGPPGAVHDFADVVEAAARRREGKPDDALALLEPLRGKIADPLERGLYSEELVHALVDGRRLDDAIRAMLDWAEQAPQADRDAAIASIQALIRGMPAPALEAGLRTLGEEAESDPGGKNAIRAEARRWLSQATRARLVSLALTERDPELAKRLVDSSPTRLGHDESRDALEALAATSAIAPSIAGRSVGVVLDVSDETARDRSADLVAGMTRALGLPTTTDREDGVRLVTHDASEDGDVQHALGTLAGDGASILVAGVTDDSAVAASLFAERAHIPVIVLRRPAALGERAPFTFVLGADVPSEAAAVSEALTARSVKNPVRIGPGGIACDTAPAAAGDTQFPTKEWKRDGVDALVLLGDESCTRDAIAEATFASVSPLLVIGLESGATDLGVPREVVGAGRFPLGARALAPDEATWVARWGAPPTWYETLGHDAALLAAAALASFPLTHADDAATVSALHARARAELARVNAKLWSTDAPGFASGNVIARELRTTRVGGAPHGP